MNGDASVMSKSASSAGSDANFYTSDSANKIDNLFPLFVHLTQDISIPNFIYILTVIYFVIQTFTTALWIERNDQIQNSPHYNGYLYLYKIAYIDFYIDSENLITVAIVVYLVILAAIIGMFSFQIYYFSHYRRFIRWTLYPTRLFFEILPLILSHPIAHLAASTFLKITGPNCPGEIYFYFIASILLYIFCLLLLLFSSAIISSSAYIERKSFCTFDFSALMEACVGSSALSAVNHCFLIFPSWTTHPVIVLHIIIICSSAYKLRTFPFIRRDSNCLGLANSCTMVFLDILSLANIIYPFLPGLYFSIAGIACFIISAIIINFIMESQIKKLKRILAYNGIKSIIDMKDEDKGTEAGEVIILDESDKCAKLEENGLQLFESNVIFYLHYGLEYMSDFFLDFTLIKYIVQNNPSVQSYLACIKFLLFFPNETRLLNLMLHSVSKNKKYPLKDRFLLFNAYHIKVLRQSSSSVQSAEKLYQMKTVSKGIQSQVRNFFTKSESNCDQMLELASEIERVKSLWSETLKDYPNSMNHYDEYTNFLVECCTDFEESIRAKYHSQAVEAGKNYSTDYCFRLFIRTYPSYLKKKILDFKGRPLRINTKAKKGQSSSNHSSVNSTNNTSEELTAKMEEEVGRTIITHAKTRLALQHATRNRKANMSKYSFAFNLFAALLSIVTLLFIYAFFSTYFDGRYDASVRSGVANDCRYDFGLSVFFSIALWGQRTNRYDLSLLQEIWNVEDNSNSIIDPTKTYEELIIKYNNLAGESYDSFLNSIAVLAETENVYDLCNVFLREIVTIIYFKNGKRMNDRQANLRTVLTYEFTAQALQLAKTNKPAEKWWSETQIFCSMVATQSYVSDAFKELRNNLVDDQYKTAEEEGQMLLILAIAIPTFLFVVIFAGFISVTILFYREVNRLVNLLLSIDASHKLEAAQLIKKGSTEEADNGNSILSASSKGTKSSIILFNIIFGVLYIVVVIMIVLILLECMNINNYFKYMASFTYNNSVQAPVYIDSLINLICYIFLSGNNKVTTEAMTAESALDLLNNWTDTLISVREQNLISRNGIPSLKGFDDRIDKLLSKEQCKPAANATFHELYKCSSTSQLASYFRDMVTEAVAKVDTYNSEVKSSIPVNLIHLAMNHAIPMIQQIDEYLDELVVKELNAFKNSILIYFIVGEIISFIALLIGFLFLKTLDSAYEMALILLRRIPPLAIISEHRIVDFLINRERTETGSAMTTAAAIIFNSPDCIICLSPTGVVESVNQAVTNLLGYTPEQMLGQNFTTAIAPSEHEKLLSQLSLMKNKQSPPSFEDHTICITDANENVPCSLMMLAMTDDSDDIESFVLVIRDESQLIQRQHEAELAKQQSEQLLYQILPRGIVNRINQGEMDITFSVPSATVMFIDIVKFSEFSASLSPQEIMGTLSTLFNAFDDAISKHPLLIKIKLIGDVYMCAGGLFDPEEPPSSHAEQMIQFGLEALDILEDINIRLNSSLQVRIGINTGGPLIAGVLGTDKPVFDIIGDPINIAARLQSTDIPCKIQISQATYELVKDKDFNIEPRGEVYLKGKGNQPAFLVKPKDNFGFASMASTDALTSTALLSAMLSTSEANL